MFREKRPAPGTNTSVDFFPELSGLVPAQTGNAALGRGLLSGRLGPSFEHYYRLRVIRQFLIFIGFKWIRRVEVSISFFFFFFKPRILQNKYFANFILFTRILS